MFGSKSDNLAQSGAEMMMRSLGMGEILDMAKAMATDGTFGKILEFANKADEILATLKKVEDELKRINGGGPGPADNLAAAGAGMLVSGPNAGHGGPVGASLRLVDGSAGHYADGRSHDAGRDAGDGAATVSDGHGAASAV